MTRTNVRVSAIIIKELEKKLKEISKLGKTKDIQKIMSEIKKMKKM